MEKQSLDETQNPNSKKPSKREDVRLIVDTEHGSVDITLDRLIEANEAIEKDLPKTCSEEQKERVVSNLMSRLWGGTASVPEAPPTSDISSPPWSSVPASSAEYGSYKREIQNSVSFEAVVGKVNPYTGYRIRTQEDYDLYCDFLLQQKVNDVKLSNAADKISKLEAELSSLRKGQASKVTVSNESSSQKKGPVPKPIITASPSQIPPKTTHFPPPPSFRTRRKYRAGDHSILIAALIFLILFWIIVVKN